MSESMSEPAAASSSGFVCVCVQKSVEFNIVDHKLHRATKDQELHEELEKLSACTPSQYAYQLGGGCRVMGASGSSQLHIASWGESVAVFEGTLSNLTELITAFPSSHTTTAVVATAPQPLPSAEAPAAPADASAPAPSADAAPNPAHLLCLMYELIGSQLLELLKGRFSFCLYHGKTGRVLAARDGSGSVPLFQGMSAAQSLVISSREEFTASCTDVKSFEPGYFKYGWYAEPRKFGPGQGHGHSPSGHHSHQWRAGSARNSLDQQRGSGSARCSLDQPRHPAQQHQPQQQQQHGAKAGSSRRSMDSGSSRRDSPEVQGGRTAGKEGKGAATQIQAQAQSPAAVEAEGWTAVGGVRSRSGATGAGSSPAPRGLPQGRRCSMDNNRSPQGAVQARTEHLGPAVQSKPQGGARPVSGRRSMDVPSSSSTAGFHWDVNAPAYNPQPCESR